MFMIQIKPFQIDQAQMPAVMWYDMVLPVASSGGKCGVLVQMARSKKACIIFFDEVDAIGGARFDDGAGGDNEVQRTMLEIVNQLDGFDARGNIKVLMATNRPDTLDPALLRPGRLDRKIEFGLPDLKARTQIFKIHTKCGPVQVQCSLPALVCWQHMVASSCTLEVQNFSAWVHLWL